MTQLAPITLFVFNRPEHTLKTLEALKNNYLSNQSELIIFSDGPKSDADIEAIEETRKIIKSVNWCKDLITHESKDNKGLARSIVEGVTEIVNYYGKIIVLEDDIVTSPGFLTYMNEALKLYESEEKVFHISGYMHPIDRKLPETFFYNVNSCWGWGTWKRAWRHYLDDAKELYNELIKNDINWNDFNKGQGKSFQNQLLRNINGTLNTWAVKWHASIYLKQAFCLHPGKTLVKNIGFDGSGERKGDSEKYFNPQLTKKIAVRRIPLKENKEVIKCLLNKHKKSKVSKSTMLKKLKNLYFKSYNIKNKLVKLSRVLKKEDSLKLEFKRLKSIPRYQIGYSDSLFEYPIKYVDSISLRAGYKEIFLNKNYNFFSKNKTPFIVDCGSNIGLSIIFFKQKFPNCRILAFEADPRIYNVLVENIDTFKYTNIKAHNSAVWIQNTQLMFKTEGGFSGRMPLGEDKENLIKINAIRLKEFLNEKIDFLKIDIEGSEFQVVKDCERELNNVEQLFIEYHSHINEEQVLGELLNILKRAGFRYHIHEAFTIENPFMGVKTNMGMDLQLDIYAYRK